MKCPNCTRGYIRLFHPGAGERRIPCNICNGTAVLPEDIVYKPELGKIMKAIRLMNGTSLRDFSRETGRDVVEISRQERGFFRKEEL